MAVAPIELKVRMVKLKALELIKSPQAVGRAFIVPLLINALVTFVHVHIVLIEIEINTKSSTPELDLKCFSIVVKFLIAVTIACF